MGGCVSVWLLETDLHKKNLQSFRRKLDNTKENYRLLYHKGFGTLWNFIFIKVWFMSKRHLICSYKKDLESFVVIEVGKTTTIH